MRRLHIHVYAEDAFAPPLAPGFPGSRAHLRELYEDLARRMAAALAVLSASPGATSDAEWKEDLHPRRADGKFGHGGAEAAISPEKPTSVSNAKAGGMDKIRELLASGHAFTKAELVAATGLTEKRLSDYLAMLKNPKWAGKAGALKIERKGDGFFVAQADGTPAPPPPKPEVEVREEPEGAQWERKAEEQVRRMQDATLRAHALSLRVGDTFDVRRAKDWIRGAISEHASAVSREGIPKSDGVREMHVNSMRLKIDRANEELDHAERIEAKEKAAKEAKAKEVAREAAAKAASLDTSQPWFFKMTSKQVAAEIAARGYADHADFGKLDVSIANELGKSLHEHLSEFPALRENQNFVGSIQAHARWYVARTSARLGVSEDRVQKPKAPGRAWAVAWGGLGGWEGTRGIGFNEKYGSKAEAPKMEATLKANASSGWHPVGCDTIKSIADHEYGHQLDLLLGLRGNPELQAIIRDAAGEQQRAFNGMPVGPYVKANIKAAVSQYATTNAAEFIAEAWSEFKNNPRPRAAAQRVGNLIRSEYAKKYPRAAGPAAAPQAAAGLAAAA